MMNIIMSKDKLKYHLRFKFLNGKKEEKDWEYWGYAPWSYTTNRFNKFKDKCFKQFKSISSARSAAARIDFFGNERKIQIFEFIGEKEESNIIPVFNLKLIQFTTREGKFHIKKQRKYVVMNFMKQNIELFKSLKEMGPEQEIAKLKFENEHLRETVKNQRSDLKQLNRAHELTCLRLESLGIKYNKLCEESKNRKEKNRLLGQKFSKYKNFSRKFKLFWDDLVRLSLEKDDNAEKKLNELEVIKTYERLEK